MFPMFICACVNFNYLDTNMETCIVNMEEIESDIQKKLVGLCQLLPTHVQFWKDNLRQLQGPVKALMNFAEQLRFVEQANINYIDDFDSIQKRLQIRVLDCIEEELLTIKNLLEKLTRSNSDLKSKLATLERATVDLDWGSDSPVVKGSPLRPRLDKLLEMAYEFWAFFSEALKNMNCKIKAVHLRDGKFMQEIQQAFALNLESLEDNSVIYFFLALTQYVGDKSVL